MQMRYTASHVQHMQKALEQMNVKLTEVVAAITGMTGCKIIEAILDGERNPETLAALRDRRCKNDEQTIAGSKSREPGEPSICLLCDKPTTSTSFIIGKSISAMR